MNKEINLSKLPNEPGCYLYKDKNSRVIYVGKAKDLKKRVKSYFNKKNYDSKTKALVENISKVDFIITNNEIEAFLLENNLIKKYKPKYNINLKDSKRYAFIEETNETFPRFRISRVNKSKNKLYGPFVSAKMRDYVLDIVNKTFKLRTCNKLPKRECLRYSIGLCSAPCIKKIKKEDYLKDVQAARKVILGNSEKLIKDYKQQMKKYSDKKEYEKALDFKNKINALEMLNEKQSVEKQKTYNEDIINYMIRNDKVYLLIFNINKGLLENKQEFIFEYHDEFFEEFLNRYYSENNIPTKIILPSEVDESLRVYIQSKVDKKIEFVIPKRGELKKLLELVKKNIEISFFGKLETLKKLKQILKLPQIPYIIECFDISHLSGTNIVASMVQFRNGISSKTNYRRFKLKTVYQNDDFASMREVIKRRYSRLIREKEEFPDLILVDGGKGQLNMTLKVLEELNIKIPTISIAKKFEEIYLPSKEGPIKLHHKNKVRLLLQEIRDEAHRFAINYNRLLRKKSLISKN